MAERGTVIRTLPGNRAVIMSSQCEFKEIRLRKQVAPGEEVVYAPGDVCGRRFPVRFTAVAVSFILLCLIALATFQQLAAARAYAWVAFDRPALELRLDRDFRVRGARAFDGRGQDLLKSGHLVEAGLDQAVAELVGDCLRKKYLAGDRTNYLTVSLYFPGGRDDRGLLRVLGDRLQAELDKEGIEAEVFFLRVDRSTRDQALQQEVSPARYLLWREARRQGLARGLRDAISPENPGIREVASRIAVQVRRCSGERKRLHAPGIPGGPVGPPPGATPAPGTGRNTTGSGMHRQAPRFQEGGQGGAPGAGRPGDGAGGMFTLPQAGQGPGGAGDSGAGGHGPGRR